MDVRTRRQRIVQALNERGQLHVGDMAAELECSEMTVRRDLESLEREGVLRRVHGGAVRGTLGAEETPYALRALQRVEAKAAIGAAAAELLVDGETVVLDGGSTVLEVARALRDRRLTVMPLAVRPLIELCDCAAVRLILPGGEVRPGELSLTGGLTESAFSSLRFDTYVMSVCGIDAQAGITTHLLAEADVKRTAARASRRVVAVADSSKLGRVAFGHVCSPADIDVLVTDRTADEALVESLVRAGVDVRTA